MRGTKQPICFSEHFLRGDLEPGPMFHGALPDPNYPAHYRVEQTISADLLTEEMAGAVPWYDDVVRTPMRRSGSYWAVPDQPGLGVEINEVEAAKHPFKQEVIHTEGAVLEDGTIVDW